MTTHIIDKNGGSIDSTEVTSKPSDKHFRNAWTLSGKVISEDMAAAREIFRDKIREVRKPLLEEQDVMYMKALEDGDSSAQNTAKAAKKKLRDAPANVAIDNAGTAADLKKAWDTDVLGTSPYA